MTTGIKTRPTWNDEMKEELAKYAGDLVYRWCNAETSLEDCIEDSRKILRWHSNDDGFQLSKEFEREGYSADPELVDKLDNVSYHKYRILEDHIKKWVKESEIVLPLSLETKVTISLEYKPWIGEITKLYPDKAMYGVWVEGKSGPKGTSHYVIESENCIPELLQPQINKNMKRNEGFYFVKINRVWTVAKWVVNYRDSLGKSGDWLLPGSEMTFTDEELEINEERILPPNN